jgi:magnesium transporter
MIPFSKIDEALSEGNVEKLKEALQGFSDFELAEIITRKSEDEQLQIFRAIPTELRTETFTYLPAPIQRHLIKSLPSSEAATIIRNLSPDDRTAYLEDLPKKTIDELVKLLPYDERVLTLTLLGYPEGSVGRLMTPDYLAVKLDWTVAQVLDYIREYGHDSETIDVIYIIDDEGKLIDDIRIKEFLLATKEKKVRDIADGTFVALSVNDSEEKAANLFQQYNRVALPIIDSKGVLLGIVTFDDIIRLLSEVSTEDIQKIGGTEALDEPYLQAPFFELMQKRAGWLVVLFIGELFTATAMGYFEDEIAKAVVLTLFLPLIISSGGNAGSQAATLVIRAMALGELRLKDWWMVIRKEIFSGIFLGAILGTLGFFRVALWGMVTHMYGIYYVSLAFTVGFALVGVVLWGTLMGATMPLILRYLKFDPATSSAPFIATLVDVTGLIIYFVIAIIFLSGKLL